MTKFKYLKEFDFTPAGKPIGMCWGGKVMKKAEGGLAAGNPPMKNESKNFAKAKVMKSAMDNNKGPSAPPGMIADRSKLGIRGNKNPGMRKGVPVAPATPMISPMKKGGMAEKKIGKVMGEYKAGELHSGSKSGPVVKNKKQALAIALSEARNAKKK